MQHLNHVFRRGAVYIWRRRVPANVNKKCPFIQVSLQTRTFSTAKSLSALLNFTFVDFIMGVKTQNITRAEAQLFLSAIVSKELERIETERYAEVDARTPSEWRIRYLDERARTEALRKVATMGANAQLFHEDRTELLALGFDDFEIGRVEKHIEMLTSTYEEGFSSETLNIAKIELDRANFDSNGVRALTRIRLSPCSFMTVAKLKAASTLPPSLEMKTIVSAFSSSCSRSAKRSASPLWITPCNKNAG